eukprot:6479905-Amphidinium_carterae.2
MGGMCACLHVPPIPIATRHGARLWPNDMLEGSFGTSVPKTTSWPLKTCAWSIRQGHNCQEHRCFGKQMVFNVSISTKSPDLSVFDT